MPAPGTDVLIRGAGPVGCALALALQSSHLEVRVLGRSDTQAAFRPLALSHASRLILERLGVWRSLEATPIGTSTSRSRGRSAAPSWTRSTPACRRSAT